VYLFGWCGQRKDERQAYSLIAQACAAGSEVAAMNRMLLRHKGLGCKPRPSETCFDALDNPRDMLKVCLFCSK
jgi:hypothetical protein